MLCVLILYRNGGTYSLKSTPNDSFFWETFHGNFIYFSKFSAEICWEEIAEEIIFYFVLMSGLGLELWLFI